MVRVVVVGSANVDLVARAPYIPRPGETVLGRDFVTVLGGKGANQAVGAARLGADVTFVARVGQDSFGDQCLAGYENEGINLDYIVRDPDAPTGIALIAVADDGENSIIVASGANMRLSPDDVAAAASIFQRADVLLLQLEVPVDSVVAAATLARKHGVAVVLNPAPARVLPSELLHMVDVLTPNRIELAQLLGRPENEIVGLPNADLAKHMLGLGPSGGVITLGADGALAAGSWGHHHVPAFSVTPVDTTAAGDAFNAGLAVALGRGSSLVEAASYAAAAGALATTQMGAQPSLPTAQAVEDLIKSTR